MNDDVISDPFQNDNDNDDDDDDDDEVEECEKDLTWEGFIKEEKEHDGDSHIIKNNNDSSDDSYDGETEEESFQLKRDPRRGIKRLQALTRDVMRSMEEGADWVELIAPEYPAIVISAKDNDFVKTLFELRRRGFIPKHCIQKNDEMAIAVTLSAKLFLKISIELEFPIQVQANTSDHQIHRVYTAALGVICRTECLKGCHCFLIHDNRKLTYFQELNSGHQHLDVLNDYFGSTVSFHLAWLEFFSSSLLAPSLVGMGLFLYQLLFSTNLHSSTSLPLFGIATLIWGETFLSLWNRRSSILSYTWGTADVDKIEETKELSAEDITMSNTLLNIALTVLVTLIFVGMYGTLAIVLLLWALEEESMVVCMILYCILLRVSEGFCDWLAVKLNNFENCPQKRRAERSLTIRRFVLHAACNYAGPIAVVFYKQDISQVAPVICFKVAHFVYSGCLRSYASRVWQWVLDRRFAFQRSHDSSCDIWIGRSIDDNLDRDMKLDVRWQKVLVEEVSRPLRTVSDEYLEVVILYGHCAMFGAAFPLSYALVLIATLHEAKAYLLAVCKGRRKPTVDVSSIGVWRGCLRGINLAAVAVTCFIISHSSDSLLPLWSLLGFSEGDGASLRPSDCLLLLILEHCVLIVQGVVHWALSGPPEELRRRQAQSETSKRTARISERLQTYKVVEKDYVAEAMLASKQERREVALKLQTEYSSEFGYNPLFLMTVLSTPLALSVLSISPYYYLPVALGALSYLAARKDRRDRASAMGIVDDPNVLKHVLGELPRWVKHSDVERVAWLNHVVRVLWPKLSIATEKYMIDWLQPLLEAYKPTMFDSLDLAKFTLGSNALKVTGVRVQHTTEDLARLDLDIKWAGNPEVVIKVGRKSFPLRLEITNLRFSATLRVELSPLVPVFPGFGAISFCFMEKPFIDFSFNVGSFDVMNIGPSDMNVAAVVDSMVRGILEGYMLYPKKYVMPWLEDVDLQPLLHPRPEGLVVLRIKSARNLIIADYFSSDPFVEFLYMETMYRTPVVYKSLNPTWDYTVELMVFDKQVQSIEFTLWDFDLSGSNDLLGRAKLPFSSLSSSSSTDFDLELFDTTSGTLQLTCDYIPLVTSGMEREHQREDCHKQSSLNDIIFSLDPEALSSDLLEAPHESMAGTVLAAMQQLRRRDGSKASDGASSKPGVLSVSNIRCRNVKRSSKLSTKVRPFVSVSCGPTTKKTRVQPNLSDPVFEEIFHLIVRDGDTAELKLRVMDEYKWMEDECIGSVSLPVIDIIRDGCSEQEYVLDVKSHEVYIACKLEWSSAAQKF